MNRIWVIRSQRGEYWQTAKGFTSTNFADATKYTTREDAIGARALVVPHKAAAEVVEVRQ